MTSESTDRSEMARRLRHAVLNSGGPTEVSAKSGVPLRSLNHYLSGKEPKAATLSRIAKATGYTERWLISGDGEAQEGRDGLVADRLIQIQQELEKTLKIENDQPVLDTPEIGPLIIELEDIAESPDVSERYRVFANRILSTLGNIKAQERIGFFEGGFYAGLRLGREHASIDTELLREVLVAIDAYVQSSGRTILIEAKAAVASSMYDLAQSPETHDAILRPRAIEQLLKLASNRI